MKIKLNVGLSAKSNLPGPEMTKVEYAIKHGVDYVSNVSCAKFDHFHSILKSQYFGKTKFLALPFYEVCERDLDPVKALHDLLEMGYSGVTLHLTELGMIDKFVSSRGILNSRGGYYASKFREKQRLLTQSIPAIKEELLRFNAKLFLGTMCRPGKVSYDPSLYFDELAYMRDVYYSFQEAGVDTEIEVGGHLALNGRNRSELENLFGEAEPLCVMGPISTDLTNGRDNVTAALGSFLLANSGLNVTTACIITPAEHLRFPTVEDSEEGVRTFLALREAVNGNTSEHSLKSYSFATCNSPFTVIDEGKNYNKKPISGCGMCGKDQCPLRRNYYVDLKDLSSKLDELGSRDIIVVGGPFSGKSYVSETLKEAMPYLYSYIGFGNKAREMGKGDGRLTNDEIMGIFRQDKSGLPRIIDNPIKYADNVCLLDELLLETIKPVVVYVKRKTKGSLRYWKRPGRTDKDLREKMEWENEVQGLVEKKLCELGCDKLIVENVF